MADLTTPDSGKFELYRDRKLATWAIYQPRVGSVPIPYFQAMGDGYGRRVTIPAASREDAITRIEKFSLENSRAVSTTEADTIFTYGVYGTIAGGLLAAIGFAFKQAWATRIGGTVAVVGVSAGVSGKLLAPRVVHEETVVIPGLNTKP